MLRLKKDQKRPEKTVCIGYGVTIMILDLKEKRIVFV